MICDSYEIWICPDPDCDRWDIEPMRCDEHHTHQLGDYPDLVPVLVRPSEQDIDKYRPKAYTR